MTRGKAARTGATRVAPNGYHYTRTSDGWKLTHRIVCEGKLGRPLRASERVRFVDGNRQNLNPSNLEVYTTREKTAAARRTYLESKIEELQAELEELDDA